MSNYQNIPQDEVELLVSLDLVEDATSVFVDLRRFLFFKHLKGVVVFSNGLVLGGRVVPGT